MSNRVYKRSVTRRESFRLDFDADEVRHALLDNVLEDVPESAAFKLHPDGATFCWDIDYDVKGPSIEPSKTAISLTNANQPVQNPAERMLVVGQETADPVQESLDSLSADPVERGKGVAGKLKPTQNGMEYEGASQGPGDRVVAVEPSELDTPNEWERAYVHPRVDPAPDPATPTTPYEENLARHGRERVEEVTRDRRSPEDQGRDRERLVNIASGHANDQERDEEVPDEQCGGSFREGATRLFRCHLDTRHEGPCGPENHHEPEDPPKGRRRSW